MFDRQTAVTEWRARMHEAAVSGPELEELESHLLDQADAFGGLGLTEEEAFLLSARRLGDASALRAEFDRADPARAAPGRGFWTLIGCVIMAVLYPVLELVGGAIVWAYSRVLPEWTADNAAAVFLLHGAGATLVLASVLYLIYRCCERRLLHRWHARFLRWGARPWRLLLAIVSVLIATHVLAWAGAAYLQRVWATHDVVTATVLSRYTALFWAFVLPVLLVVVLRRYRRASTRRAAETAP